MLETGLTTRALVGKSISEAAGFMSRAGFRTAELCPTLTNLGIEDITEENVKSAVKEFAFRGVNVYSLGMYANLFDDNAVETAKRFISCAAESGVKYIATGCGKVVNAETYEDDYAKLRSVLREICLEGDKCGVYIALKPSVLDTVPSPRRMKNLIEDLEAETGVRLGALLSPAELIDASDEEGMFYYLKNDVVCVLASDRKFNTVTNCPMGEGSVDWARLMISELKYADRRPLIIENVTAETCLGVKHKLEEYYDEAFRTLLTRLR